MKERLRTHAAVSYTHLDVYKRQEQEGSLRLLRVEQHPNTGRTLVDYLSAIPHEWMLEQLGRRKRDIEFPRQQMRMEGTR